MALSSDSGLSWTLPRVIGTTRATELLFFPQNITAERALELGILHRVVPADELAATALELARRLAAGPTVALSAIKEAVAFGAGHTLEESLAKEDELQTRAGTSEDHVIAVRAFLAKEEPQYLGR